MTMQLAQHSRDYIVRFYVPKKKDEEESLALKIA